MKSRNILTSVAGVAIVLLTALAVESQNNLTLLKAGEGVRDTSPKIALAYVESGRKEIPDPDMFTHLIYAFTEFNDACDGVVIDHPEKLQAMADLKKVNPDLKVMIGIGGYKREGFSEMARDRKKRKAFVAQVRHIIDSLGLDGVDLDWEFPTTEAGGHTASPKDDRNYVTLVKDLRKALGKDKWISYYSNNGAGFIDHKGMVKYVDYVNASGYNLAVPKDGDNRNPLHQSPLYPSEAFGDWCVKASLERHLRLGVPREKLLMGIPFFGRGRGPFPSYLNCDKFKNYSGSLKPLWNDEAQAPYYADEKGNLVLGYDDENSIRAKMEFIRANSLPGVFIWNYDSDFEGHRLGNAIRKLRGGK